jgi:hypothetical protein
MRSRRSLPGLMPRRLKKASVTVWAISGWVGSAAVIWLTSR